MIHPSTAPTAISSREARRSEPAPTKITSRTETAARSRAYDPYRAMDAQIVREPMPATSGTSTLSSNPAR